MPMHTLLNSLAVELDRAVLLIVVLLNASVLWRLLQGTLLSYDGAHNIGALNACTAAALLLASLWRPAAYARRRVGSVVVMRLLVCIVPLVADPITPFTKGLHLQHEPWHDDPLALAIPTARGAFMLLLGSWTVGLILAALLLLPPALHLAVQTTSLLLLLSNNKSMCHKFLAQHPSNAAASDTLDAVLQAGIVSAVPSAQQHMEALTDAVGAQARCVAGAAALQVSLGFVLPTLLAWQLQSRMVKAVAAQAQARQDAALVAQAARSSQAALCSAVAAATQGVMAKALLTACAMLSAYTSALLLLASTHEHTT